MAAVSTVVLPLHVKDAVDGLSPTSTLNELPSTRELPSDPPPVVDLASPASAGDVCRVMAGRRQRFSGEHFLVVLEGGRAFASGGSSMSDEDGDVFIAHLGLGDDWSSRPIPAATEVLFPAEKQCIEVACGSLHSVYLLHDGSVWSCGAGWDGAHGHGGERPVSVPRQIADLAHVAITRIAAGSSHSLALDASGRCFSWGWGRFGQLGHGDERPQTTPRLIDALASVRVAQLAAGRAHSLALSHAGGVFSWGQQSAGATGHSCSGADAPNLTVPQVVAALDGVRARAIYAAKDISAAATGDALYRWGRLHHQGPIEASPFCGSK